MKIRVCNGKVVKIIIRDGIALCVSPTLVPLAPHEIEWRTRLYDESRRMELTPRPFEQMDQQGKKNGNIQA